MLHLLSHSGLHPFLVSGAFVVGLLVLEMLLTLVGLSSHMGQDAGIDAHADFDHDLADMSAPDIATHFDIDPHLAAHIEAEIHAHIELDGHAEVDGALDHDVDHSASAQTAGAPSLLGTALDFLGMRRLALTIWLAIFAASFAATGLALQAALNAILGFMLPASLATIIVFIPTVYITRNLASLIAGLIPRDETYVVSTQSLGGRRGTVVIGTARRDNPAQVRIDDQYGHSHYEMLEPLSDGDEVSAGADVLVIRLPGGLLRIVQTG